jgi:hypothetical protein
MSRTANGLTSLARSGLAAASLVTATLHGTAVVLAAIEGLEDGLAGSARAPAREPAVRRRLLIGGSTVTAVCSVSLEMTAWEADALRADERTTR